MVLLSYNEALDVTTERGYSQGAVLPPLLRNMVVDDLLISISNNGTHIEGYVDDIAILIVGKFSVIDIRNQRLTNINLWCTNEGLLVNILKPPILPLMFTKRKSAKTEWCPVES